MTAALPYVSPPPLSTVLLPAPRGRSCSDVCAALGGPAQWLSLHARLKRVAPLATNTLQNEPNVGTPAAETVFAADVAHVRSRLLQSAPTTWACHEGLLPVVNTCEALRRVYPCERGCAIVSGHDKPSYVPMRHGVTAVMQHHQQYNTSSREHVDASAGVDVSPLTTSSPWLDWRIPPLLTVADEVRSIKTDDGHPVPLDGMCLLNANPGYWDCDSSGTSTQRLCPCIPGDWPGERAQALQLLVRAVTEGTPAAVGNGSRLAGARGGKSDKNKSKRKSSKTKNSGKSRRRFGKFRASLRR